MAHASGMEAQSQECALENAGRRRSAGAADASRGPSSKRNICAASSATERRALGAPRRYAGAWDAGEHLLPTVIATPNALTPTPALPTTTAVPTLQPTTTAPTTAPTIAQLRPHHGTVTTGTPTPWRHADHDADWVRQRHGDAGTCARGHGELHLQSHPHLARTTMNMTGLAQGGTGVAVVLSGTCSAPGGVIWQGAPFTADANGKVSNFKVNYRKVNGVPAGSVVRHPDGAGGQRDAMPITCSPADRSSAPRRRAGTRARSPSGRFPVSPMARSPAVRRWRRPMAPLSSR